MTFHPPARLARSEQFLAQDCIHRLLFRPLWVRGEERRWPTDRIATAEDRIFWELEALGVLVGPGARATFDGALSAWLRVGALRREAEDLVLPILSGDTAKEQPAAATLRKRAQRARERERGRGTGGEGGEGGGSGETSGRDRERDIRPMSRGDVTPPGRDLDRDGPRDPRRDVTPVPASPERREERNSSSLLSETPSVSNDSPASDTARGPERDASRPVTPQVTLSTLTEEEVFGVLERDAGGRIGLHPRSLRPRLLLRLAEEGVTREQLAVMARLARERTLYLQDKHAVIDLALLVGARDGEAKVLGSWINATHRAIARAREEDEREARRLRDLAASRSTDLPGPVRIQGPPPLAQAAQGGVGPRVPYLEQRRPRAPAGGDLRVVEGPDGDVGP